MKILFIIWSLRSGGSEKQLLLISTALAEAGLRPCVLSLIRTGRHDRIQTLITAARQAGVQFIEPRADSFFPALWSGLRELGKHSQRLVWTWGRRADLLGKLAKKLGRDFQLVCSVRHADPERLRRYRRFYTWEDKRVDLYVSNSHRGCELLQEHVPGSQARCRILYNALSWSEAGAPGIDLPDKPPRPLNLLMLGNLRLNVKGYGSVLDLAVRMRDAALPVKILVGGYGTEAVVRNLNAQILSRGLEEILTLVGWVQDPEAFLRRGHAFFLSSRAEGFPNALLEAMNLGLPSISTPVGDVARVFQDREHIRIVPGTPETTVEVLKDFLADWPGAVRLGKLGQARCREVFHPDVMAGEARSILENLAFPAQPDALP